MNKTFCMITNSKPFHWCCLVLLFLLGTATAQAQTKAQLNGIVTTGSGDPLDGVSITVRLAGSKDKEVQSLSTDDKGVFMVSALSARQQVQFYIFACGLPGTNREEFRDQSRCE